eukprot:3767072-Alexandrium_andersonii.AAC.1
MLIPVSPCLIGRAARHRDQNELMTQSIATITCRREAPGALWKPPEFSGMPPLTARDLQRGAPGQLWKVRACTVPLGSCGKFGKTQLSGEVGRTWEASGRRTDCP